jgi:hypothetical protein
VVSEIDNTIADLVRKDELGSEEIVFAIISDKAILASYV